MCVDYIDGERDIGFHFEYLYLWRENLRNGTEFGLGSLVCVQRLNIGGHCNHILSTSSLLLQALCINPTSRVCRTVKFGV